MAKKRLGGSSKGRPTGALHAARYREFRRLLTNARKDVGLSQLEAARLLEKPASFVSKSESGERRVDVVELLNFAKIYKKRLEYFEV